MLDPQTVVLRLAVALLFGALIGIEREWRHKTAGLRTNALVAFGSAGFALMSNTFGANNHSPAQLAAAVVSGIGFIGAGVIIHRGVNVQGVTTAATLWAGAAMGVAAGFGYFAISSTLLGGIMILQLAIRRAEIAIARRAPQVRTIELRVQCDEPSLPAVNAAWAEIAAEKDAVALRHSTARTADGIEWHVVFNAAIDLPAFEAQILRAPGVKKIEVRQTPPDI